MPEDRGSSENTYLFDSENATEMARLINLDRFTTQGMGGPLAGLPATVPLDTVLDIACGPGGWVLDVAFVHPESEVMGIDISQTMISYANARARSQGILNASFGVMNILQPLDFGDNCFDLVNMRFLGGVLRPEKWSRLLGECYRVLKPGGILRWTEADKPGMTNSVAFERLDYLLALLLRQRGYGFSPDGRLYGFTMMLPRYLRLAGLGNIQLRSHVLEFSAGSEANEDVLRNMEVAFTMAIPLLTEARLASKREIESLIRQMRGEMLAEDFCGVWCYLSACGEKQLV